MNGCTINSKDKDKDKDKDVGVRHVEALGADPKKAVVVARASVQSVKSA